MPPREPRPAQIAHARAYARRAIPSRFWAEFLERPDECASLFRALSPTDANWLGTGAGLGGVAFNANIRQHDCRVELYIDRGAGRDEENMAIFESLLAERETIESDFDSELDWQPLAGKRACRKWNWN